MQEPRRTVADATVPPGPDGRFLGSRGRSYATIVRNTRSAKEWKNREFSGGFPREIRQKIANCMKCPKGANNRHGQRAEYTTSQFQIEKLQIKVDSVGCLWYSNNNSFRLKGSVPKRDAVTRQGSPAVWMRIS